MLMASLFIGYLASAIRHPLCPQVENHDMTDIREKTFRLTQFARCAG